MSFDLASRSFDACRTGLIISTSTFTLHKWCTHMAQVNPRFVVTCVAHWKELQLLAINLKRAVFACKTFLVGDWKLDEPTQLGRFTRQQCKTTVCGQEGTLPHGRCHFAARARCALLTCNVKVRCKKLKAHVHLVILVETRFSVLSLPTSHTHVLRHFTTSGERQAHFFDHFKSVPVASVSVRLHTGTLRTSLLHSRTPSL